MRPVPQPPSAPGALILACAVALAGCRGAPPPTPHSPPGSPASPAPEPAGAVESAAVAAAEPAPAAPADARSEAQSALAAGDIAATRAALDALVTQPLLAACEAHLRAGRVADALAEAERALETSPELPAALFLAGACHAALADRNGDPAGFERAVERLARARTCAGAQGTASRIARQLGRVDDALALARAGLAPGAGACAEWARVAEWATPIEAPERALALASLAAWRARRATDPAGATKHFEEAEYALSLALWGAPADAWVWRTLGEAYLEAGRPAEARATLENGLDRLPSDSGLFGLIAKAAFEDGGAREVAHVFARVQAKRPDVGLAWWYPGESAFKAALGGGADARALYDAAERSFAACRARDAKLASACLSYESLCRTGRGWIGLEEGELEQAWREFRGAAELVAGGLELEQGPLRSARAGLGVLIERHLAQSDLDGAVRAAEFLAGELPGDVAAARQAANLTRDLGDRWNLLERDMKLAAQRRMNDPLRLEELRVEIGTSRPGDDLRGTLRERDRFWDFGDRRGRAAHETYLRSLAHYERALQLAPGDLRLGCDAAALVVRRLGRGPRAEDVGAEVNRAEDLLLRLVEVGQRRSEQGLDEETRDAFDETWADAHQLLGELYLEQRGEPRKARLWFERCLELAPVPRSEITDTWLPRCLEAERAAAEGRR